MWMPTGCGRFEGYTCFFQNVQSRNWLLFRIERSEKVGGVLQDLLLRALSSLFTHQAGSGFECSLQFVLEADGTRAPHDARREWTRSGGSGRNSLDITFLARRAAAERRRRVAVARPVRIAFARLFVFSDARCKPVFPARSSASKWHIRAAPRTSTRADAREQGAVSDETNIKVYRGILPCRFAVYPAATPPSRPAKRVGICTSHLRMVPIQAERGNTKRSLAHPCECPECANSAHPSRTTENLAVYPASHRATFVCTFRRCHHRGLPSAHA